MRMAVISDTHGNKNAMEKSLKLIEGCDSIIHLGDNVKDVKFYEEKLELPIYSVRGNCDFTSRMPEDRLEEIGEMRIFMTHGHKYNVKMTAMNIMYKGREVEADIVLYGHTHIPALENIDGIWIMNPGSLGNPRMSGASLGIINIEDGAVKPEIIEI